MCVYVRGKCSEIRAPCVVGQFGLDVFSPDTFPLLQLGNVCVCVCVCVSACVSEGGYEGMGVCSSFRVVMLMLLCAFVCGWVGGCFL